MKRPQSSGGMSRRAIPAQSSTTTSNNNINNSNGNTTTSRGRSVTPQQQQHPLLISSSSQSSSSSDLSIRGIGNSKVNSSEERLRLEAKNLITKWTTRDDNVQIKDNLILNTSLNSSINHLSPSNILNSSSSSSNNSNTKSSSIRNENTLLKSSNNPITTKSIIESTANTDQTSSTLLLNTPLMDKIKDKRPSELTRWEKLRLSMERKKNIVDLNVLQPTFESKIQLVKNDLIQSDINDVDDHMQQQQEYDEYFPSSLAADNNNTFNTMMLTTTTIKPVVSLLSDEKKDLDSLFSYKPFSSETTNNSIEKPKFNDFIPSSTTVVNSNLINNSLDQQMNIFKTKLMGTNYLNNAPSSNTKSNNSLNNNNTNQSNNNNQRKKERIEIPTIVTNQQQQPSSSKPSSNYVTTQKEIFIVLMYLLNTKHKMEHL